MLPSELEQFRESVATPVLMNLFAKTQIPEGARYIDHLEISYLDGRNCGFESYIKATGLEYQNGKVEEYLFEETDINFNEFLAAHEGSSFVFDGKLTVIDELEELQLNTVMHNIKNCGRFFHQLKDQQEMNLVFSSVEYDKMKHLLLQQHNVLDKTTALSAEIESASARIIEPASSHNGSVREDAIPALKDPLPQNQLSLLEHANSVLKDVLSKPNGSDVFFAANILYMLHQEEVPLEDDELNFMAQRIMDVADYSVVPLLTAERVDAVCTLLNNGMRQTRSPEFPEATPDQMKNLLFNCNLDVFAEIIEAVAVDNQAFYAPDNAYSEDAIQMRKKAVNAIENVTNERLSLDEKINSACNQVLNTQSPFDEKDKSSQFEI